MIIRMLMVSALFAGVASADVVIKDAWARSSTGPNGAMFMVLENAGAQDEKLVNAEISPDYCDHMELHTHLHENGVMKMRQVDAIAVPAHGMAELKPGGLHIMFMQLKKPMGEKDVLPVTLTFASGEKQTLSVPVKAAFKPCHCNDK